MSDDLIAQLRTKYCCAAWNEGCNCGDIADRIEAQAAEIERLRQAVGNAVDFLRNAPLESGFCCCGNPIEGHSMGDGHSPVDDLAYHAFGLERQLSAALTGKAEQ